MMVGTEPVDRIGKHQPKRIKKESFIIIRVERFMSFRNRAPEIMIIISLAQQ